MAAGLPVSLLQVYRHIFCLETPLFYILPMQNHVRCLCCFSQKLPLSVIKVLSVLEEQLFYSISPVGLVVAVHLVMTSDGCCKAGSKASQLVHVFSNGREDWLLLFRFYDWLLLLHLLLVLLQLITVQSEMLSPGILTEMGGFSKTQKLYCWVTHVVPDRLMGIQQMTILFYFRKNSFFYFRLFVFFFPFRFWKCYLTWTNTILSITISIQTGSWP